MSQTSRTLVIGIIVLFVGIGAYTLIGTKRQSQIELRQNETTGWQTYRSYYGFQIQYPPEWRVIYEQDFKTRADQAQSPRIDVSFGTGTFGNEGYEGDFFIEVYDKTLVDVTQTIKDMGSQFSDRQEKREHIVVGGVPALKTVVTTAEVPNWVYEKVIIEQRDKVYVIHNGAMEHDLFDEFYNSIRFDKV